MDEGESKRRIVDAYFKGESVKCPNDGADLKITKYVEGTGNWVITVDCPRCGFGFEWNKARDE